MQLTSESPDQSKHSLRRDVRAGFAAIDEGQFSDYDETGIRKLADRVKANGRARLREQGVRPDAK